MGWGECLVWVGCFFSFFGSDVWVANGGCTIAPKLLMIARIGSY